MTMLARAGVPGLVLWVLVLVSWFGMLMRAMLTARARGHEQWADLFLFIGLLCRGDRYQCDVRRRARRSDAGHLVLVPVRLRPWVCDGLSGSALRRIARQVCTMSPRSADWLGAEGRLLATRISYAAALPH